MSEPRETTKIRIGTLKEIAEKLCTGCARGWEFDCDGFDHIPPSPADKEQFECQTPTGILRRIRDLENSIAPLWFVLFSEEDGIGISISPADMPLDKVPAPDRSIGGKAIHIYVQGATAADALKRAEEKRAYFLKEEEKS